MGAKDKKQKKSNKTQDFTNNSSVETSNEIFEQKTMDKAKNKKQK